MRSVQLLVGDLLKCFPGGTFMIEWDGAHVFIYNFFDQVSMRRAQFSAPHAHGTYVIPKELVTWLKKHDPERSVTLKVVRDEEGDSIMKCSLSSDTCTHMFRAPVVTHDGIEWDREVLASVKWTKDMNDAARAMHGQIYVDLHKVVTMTCGCASSMIKETVEGEACGVYDIRADIEGQMTIYKTMLMEIKNDTVLYLFAPIL